MGLLLVLSSACLSGGWPSGRPLHLSHPSRFDIRPTLAPPLRQLGRMDQRGLRSAPRSGRPTVKLGFLHMWHACVAGPVTSTRQRHSIKKINPLKFIGATRQSLVVAEFRGRVIVGRKVWFSYISIGVGCDTLGACMSQLGEGVNYFAGGCHIAPRTQGQSDVKG